MKKHRYLSDRSGCLECGRDYEGPNDPLHFREPPGPKVIMCLAHRYGEWHPFEYGRIKFCTICTAVVRQTKSGWVFPAGGPF